MDHKIVKTKKEKLGFLEITLVLKLLKGFMVSPTQISNAYICLKMMNYHTVKILSSIS